METQILRKIRATNRGLDLVGCGARGRVAAARGRIAAARTSCRLLSNRRPLLAEAFYKKVSNHSAAYPGSPGKAAPRRCAPNRATFSLSPPARFYPNLPCPGTPTSLDVPYF